MDVVGGVRRHLSGGIAQGGKEYLLKVWFPSQTLVTFVTEFCYNYQVKFGSRIAHRSGAEIGLW